MTLSARKAALETAGNNVLWKAIQSGVEELIHHEQDIVNREATVGDDLTRARTRLRLYQEIRDGGFIKRLLASAAGKLDEAHEEQEEREKQAKKAQANE